VSCPTGSFSGLRLFDSGAHDCIGQWRRYGSSVVKRLCVSGSSSVESGAEAVN
jgi:hypothetical protein